MTALKGFIFRSALPGLTLLLLLGACSLPNKVGKGAPAPVNQGTADGIGGADPFTTYLYAVRDNIVLPAVDDLLAGRHGGNPCAYQACEQPEGNRPQACRRAPILSADQQITCEGLLQESLLALRAKLQDPAVTLLGRHASFQTATANPLMRTQVSPGGVIEASQLDIEALRLDSYEIAAVLVHEYLHKIEGAIRDGDPVGFFSGPLGGSAALTAVGFAVALQAAAPAPSEPAPGGEAAPALALLRFEDVTTVNFGTRSPGSVALRRLVLRNAGEGAATDMAAALLGTPFNQTTGSCLSATSLEPGATCTLDVKFRPAAEGDFFGALTVSYHDQVSPRSLPIPLYGRSRAPVLFTGRGGTAGSILLRSPADGSAPTRFPQGLMPFSAVAEAPRMAVGDLNGDGRREIVVASGYNAGGKIKVYDAVTGSPYDGPLPPLRPFGESYGGGLYVALADVDRDDRDDLIVASGVGIVAEVRVYSGATGALLRKINPFSTFSAGINVAAADVNGDGAADIVVAADTGGGPHVRLYDGATGSLLTNTFVYAQTFTGGVSVALADVTGDGLPELITGAGWSGGPHVRVLDPLTLQVHKSIMVFDDGFPDGVRVTAGDVNGDGKADIVISAYRGSRRPIRILSGADYSLLRDIPLSSSGGGGPLDPKGGEGTGPGGKASEPGPNLYPLLGYF